MKLPCHFFNCVTKGAPRIIHKALKSNFYQLDYSLGSGMILTGTDYHAHGSITTQEFLAVLPKGEISTELL